MVVKKISEIILSIPQVVFFNFKHFPFCKAIKLPVWIHYNTSVRCSGSVVLNGNINTAMIRIGFHTVPGKDERDKTSVCVERDGVLEFQGTAHIGRGSRIYVDGKGRLKLGDNFAISASSTILCYKSIVMGNDILFSWDCLVMDSDTHSIYDESKKRINNDNEITVGDKVWIGCRCLILKGSKIPSNVIIGANSLVLGENFENNSIIVGNPAKSVKKIGGWEI